jgi:hypothetical protein
LVTVDEDFPYQSQDPELQPPQGLPAPPVIEEPADQDLKILLRLLIGTAVEGNDEFRRRARLWQAGINITDPSKVVISVEDESEAARLRYGLIGFLFQAIEAGQDSLSSLNTVSSRAFRRVSRLFAPLTRSRLWRPVQANFDSYSEKGESIVNTWIKIGRREERLSRTLARQQAYEQMVNEVIDYVAQKPEIRDIVQQQSVGMAEEIVGEIRERSIEFDEMLEKRVNSILRRRSNP